MKVLKVSLGAAISLAIILAAAWLVWRNHEYALRNPLSDDATITAALVNVAPAIPGRIVSLPIAENALVRKGDLLFELDPQPYRLAVEQAKADLAVAEALLADQGRTVVAEQANAVIAEQQVERARLNLDWAERALRRLEPMAQKGYVSKQQLDDARNLRNDAAVSLKEAERQVEAADALVGNEAAAAALVEARRAALAVAEYELANTVVRAPHDGRVVGLTVASGEYVSPVTPVFTLVDVSQWYVSASYRETVLPGITVGDCVTAYALADRDTAIRGVVEGISAGVTSTDVINLPVGLPVAPKSLDWVRIEQRFPVRIRLIDPPERLMRVGASALAIVHNDQSC